MNQYTLLLHSPDCKTYWKQRSYKTYKEAELTYLDLKVPLNLDKAKVTDNKTPKEIKIQ